MRYPWRRFVMAAASAVSLSACNLGDVRNCPINSTSSSSYGLQYNFVIPSTCPVELDHPGELKQAGAYVSDPNYDMSWLEVSLENSSGQPVGAGDNPYEEDVDGRWSAQAIASYAAGTGSAGNAAPGATYNAFANDVGFFGSGHYLGEWLAYATVTISYKAPSALASVIGPDLPLANTVGTWNSSVSGGAAPYAYAWYRNGSMVGTGSSYSGTTGTAEFGLRLTVTDQTGSVSNKDFWVDVDGIRSTITGPSTSYASSGGDTWTLSVRGGYLPYTYNWYLDDGSGNLLNVSSDSQYSGYPGQGSHDLIAVVTDAHGKTSSARMTVQGLGAGDGQSCDPVPPQLVCSP